MKKRILAAGATVALAGTLAAPAAIASTHPARMTAQVTLHGGQLQGNLEIWATIRSSRKARASTV